MKKPISNSAGRENKPHIGIFGRCNSGKSTLLNFIVDAQAAIVSPHPGTTTDEVRKSYEILDFAPVIFIDTAGTDDDSPLGDKRIARTIDAAWRIDLALLVFRSWGEPEQWLARYFDDNSIAWVAVHNIFGESDPVDGLPPVCEPVEVDAANGSDQQRDALLERIKAALPESSYKIPSMFGDKVARGDLVLLVCPIDSEAPVGRLILPQVQAIRELLDTHAAALVVQPEQVEALLTAGMSPKLVVTDSQVFPLVRGLVPEDIEVTSFSILLAGAKGDMEMYRRGLESVETLRDGDRILIAESCSHQVSCEDIGRVKIPRWLEQYTGRKFRYEVVSGLAPLPDDISEFALMVQCGGCMATRSQLQNRIRKAASAGVPVTNYGMLIRKIAR